MPRKYTVNEILRSVSEVYVATLKAAGVDDTLSGHEAASQTVLSLVSSTGFTDLKRYIMSGDGGVELIQQTGAPATNDITITTPTLFAQSTGATLKDLIVAPSLADIEGQDGSVIALAAVDGLLNETLPSDVRADYVAASAGRRFVEAAAYVRWYPRDLVKLAEALESISTPVLSVWGEKDPLEPPINADLLLQKLPKSRAIYLDASHFVWEQQSEPYATAVLDWVKGGYAAP